MHKLMIMLMFAPEGGEGGGGGTPSPAPSPAPAPAPAAPGTPGSTEPAKGPELPKPADPKNEGPADPPKPELPKYFTQFEHGKRESDEYRDLIGKHKSLTDLADDYIATNNRLSKAIEIPGKDATPEQVNAFFKRLGVPDNPEDYDTPDNGLSPDMAKGLSETMRREFKRNGMTKTQAKGMWNMITKNYAAGVASIEQMKANQAKTFDARMATQLQDTYPVKADRDNAMQEAATMFKQHMQRTGLGKVYKDAGLIYDPSFVMAIARDEKSRSGNSLITGKTGTPESEGIGAFGNGYSREFIDENKRR